MELEAPVRALLERFRSKTAGDLNLTANFDSDPDVFTSKRSRLRGGAATSSRWRKWLVAAAILVIVTGGTGSAHAAPAGGQPGDAFQVDVSNDQRYSAGEPEIAVNPRNPQNIVIAYPRAADLVTQALNQVAVTFDGGHTWTKHALETGNPVYGSGGDAIVGVGPDGTFYAGGTYSAPGIMVLRIAVWKSVDGGRTWTGPTYSMGTESTPDLMSRGYLAPPGFASPTDRPWIAVDPQDGRVYSSGRHVETGEGFVATSSDQARTWSRLQSFDGANYQRATDTGAYASISAAHGQLAAAYAANAGTIATASSAALGPGCHCVIFETSPDGGATWIRHRLPGVTPVIGPAGNNVSCPQVGCVPGYLAADPVRDNHYAIMVDNGIRYDIYLTTDGGLDWSKTATLSEEPPNSHTRPWLAFGRNGVLGAMWRSDNNGKQDVYAAVSPDGGHSFSAATKVNEGSGPYQQTQAPDDSSAIAIGANRAYIAWGDARKGNTAIFFASVPLSLFFPRGS
jgi:hypothetical protein